MARKKLQTFSADDAGDEYTPSVKTIKGANISAGEKNPGNINSKNIGKAEKKPVKKVNKKEETTAAESNKKPNPKFTKPAEQKQEDKQTKSNNGTTSTVKKTKSKSQDTISGDLKRVKAESVDSSDTVIQLVGFKIGEEEFGIEIEKIQEINRITEITSVPRTPRYVLGVINLRGNIIPVVNMRARFGFNDNDFSKDSRIIVLELQDNVIGILVDSVTEVIRLPSGTVEPPPNLATNIETDYISGVGKLEDRLLILLDIDKVFTSEQMDEFAEAAA